MPDKGLFAALSVLGFAAILIGKRYGANPDLMTVSAGGAMLFYGMIAFSIPSVRLRLDRLGDNFYYLGFIYTLASLSASLLELRGHADIQALLGNFGLALATTIIGIAGRVLFAQLRSDLDDVEEELRRDLAHTSADLKASLGMSLRDFETFRTGVLQATKETTHANITQVVGRLDAAVQAFIDAGRKSSGASEALSIDIRSLTEAINTLRSSVDVTARSPEERALRTLNELVDELRSIAGSLDTRLPPARRRRRFWHFGVRTKDST